MEATVADMREAWYTIKEFLSCKDATYLFLRFDSEHFNGGYAIIKLPYGKNIDLLYAILWHNSVLHPGIDLKYAGFYSRLHGQVYNIREPLDRFFGFDGITVLEPQLKDMVVEAVQREVAERTISKVGDYIRTNFDSLENEIRRNAETAYSRGQSTLDFYKKIAINDWRISESAMVDFIDDPENIQNPNSQLNRYVDDLINGHEEELARLWCAHRTSQKLLDRLYAENGDVNDE